MDHCMFEAGLSGESPPGYEMTGRRRHFTQSRKVRIPRDVPIIIEKPERKRALQPFPKHAAIRNDEVWLSGPSHQRC
ncbi:hypothetical protein KC367_g262 [Hortaea werneckii]|nr:hypothetical protein KC367_g262 [Hortaea werneckii]